MKKAAQWIEYAAFRTVVALVRLLPLDMASAVVGQLWAWFAPLNKRHKRALANIAMAMPEKSEAEREAIVRAMWRNLGRVMAESLQLDRLLADTTRIESNGKDIASRLDPNKGSLVLSLHTGNWEICVWPMTQAGCNPAGVYQKVKNPKVETFIHSTRRDLYPGGLFPKSHDTGRKLVAWVKRGNQLGVLSDQRDNKGITVPFFGQPAPSTPLPAMLAVRLGVPVIIGRVIRTKGVNFRIEGEFLEMPSTGDTKADIETGTARIQATFEQWIREYPDQWMWGHRRWRSRGTKVAITGLPPSEGVTSVGEKTD